MTVVYRCSQDGRLPAMHRPPRRGTRLPIHAAQPLLDLLSYSIEHFKIGSLWIRIILDIIYCRVEYGEKRLSPSGGSIFVRRGKTRVQRG